MTSVPILLNEAPAVLALAVMLSFGRLFYDGVEEEVRKMSRQVVRARPVMRGVEATKGDVYFERLLKLIPGETVAMYLFLDGVLRSALGGDPARLYAWQWSIFGILLVGNVPYLRQLHNVSQWTQCILLSAAFVVWVITVGGPFESLSFYEPFIGSVTLGLFTFFVPAIYKGPELL